MRRRTLLAALAGGLAGLAGCSGDGEDGSVSPTDGPAPGAAPTATVTDTRSSTPTPSPRPGPVPTERVLGASATAADGLRVRAERWFALDAARYAPTVTPAASNTATRTGTDTASLPTVTPRRGRFVAYDFTAENVGDERLDAVRDSVFRLRVAGGTYRHVHSLDGVAFARVRRPEGEPPIRPLSWYEGLDPGASARLQLVFDAPARPAFRHYLAWDHPTAVEGIAGEVYLWPGGAERGGAGADS